MTNLVINDKCLFGEVTVHTTEEKKESILSEFPVPQLSAGMESFDISKKEHGEFVYDLVLLLNSYSVEPTSNGSKMLKVEFGNNHGKLSAKMWDRNGSVERAAKQLEESNVFLVNGKIEQYPRVTGSKSIMIDTLEPFTGSLNPFDLLPSTVKSLEDMTVELVQYLEELDDPFRSLALAGLKKYWSHFSVKPAARSHHHAYLGGLLKHTLGLIRFARYIRDQKANPFDAMNSLIDMAYMESRKERIANLNAEVPLRDRDLVWNDTVEHLNNVFNGFVRTKDVEVNFSLLICAIVYHDIAKIIEYQCAGEDALEKYSWLYPNADYSSLKDRKQTGIAMDVVGGGTGHIVMSIMMLREVIVGENITLTIEDIGRLNHAIAAHHGKMEWGSAAWMEKPESFLIHFVDYLDSRYEKIDELK